MIAHSIPNPIRIAIVTVIIGGSVLFAHAQNPSQAKPVKTVVASTTKGIVKPAVTSSTPASTSAPAPTKSTPVATQPPLDPCWAIITGASPSYYNEYQSIRSSSTAAISALSTNLPTEEYDAEANQIIAEENTELQSNYHTYLTAIGSCVSDAPVASGLIYQDPAPYPSYAP